jgi:hypothetical protein
MRVISLVCTVLTIGYSLRVMADEPPKSTIELDVRVLEINASKLKALGFDFQTGHSAGGDAAGFVKFLEALDREGLVQHDVALSQIVEDGKTWDAVVRWRVQTADETEDAWRIVRLRLCATQVGAETIRVASACGAQIARNYRGWPPVVDFGAAVGDGSISLVTDFVRGDLDELTKAEIRAIILITPHRGGSPEKMAVNESSPDLLAPRNVLNSP